METLNTILGERRTYTDVARTHTHSFAQLIFPMQGTLFINTPAHDFALDESRLFFLAPQCRHTFYAKNNNEFLVLDIPGHLFAPSEAKYMSGGLSPQLDDRWRALRFLLLTEVSPAATSQQLNSLFHYAYHLLRQENTPVSLQYIHQNYHRPLTLQHLAAIEGYNPTYYSEWFKKLTGLAPHAYIQQVRLNKAKELLTHTDQSILHIAQQVGYQHHASLTRLFKQHQKLTPQAYRRQSRRSAKGEPKIS